MADNEATLRSFKADIPKTLASIIDGKTINAGCGPFNLKRTNDGIALSGDVAKWILERITPDPALTQTQFVVQMILVVARIYPRVTTEEAMRTAARIYQEFLREEKIQFGSVKYAWNAEAAKEIVEASELD